MKRTLIVAAALLPLVVIGSVAVWKASGNDLRRVGAIGAESEPVALMWRGVWAEKAEYAPGQVVSFKGASYVAELESAGSAPDPWCEDDCRWARMGEGAQGPQGPRGDAGPAGPPGAQGTAGLSGFEFVSRTQAIAASTGATVVASCPVGKKVISGAYQTSQTNLEVRHSRPVKPSGAADAGLATNSADSAKYGWSVTATNTTYVPPNTPAPVPPDLVVHAACANVG